MDTISSNLSLFALEITGPYVIQLVSRVLHILPAMILVGGLYYLRTMVVPVGSEDCYAGRRAMWAKAVGICTLLLLATGFYNFFGILSAAKEAGEKLPPAYHMLFGIKCLLALLVMFIAAILSGKTEAAERFRTQMPKWLNIAKLAIVAIVVIAAILRTLH